MCMSNPPPPHTHTHIKSLNPCLWEFHFLKRRHYENNNNAFCLSISILTLKIYKKILKSEHLSPYYDRNHSEKRKGEHQY